MDKNIKCTDANAPFARPSPSKERGPRSGYFWVRFRSRPTLDSSPRPLQYISRLVVLSLFLALATAGAAVKGYYPDCVEGMENPLFPGRAPYLRDGAVGPTGDRPLAAITPAGKVLITGGTVIPPFPKAGKWTELAGDTSSRYETQHFLYLVPGESPAIELFVARDRKGEPPDGAHEMGLVKGFLSGFADKAGLKFNNLAFRDRMLGRVKIRHTLVKLASARGTLWAHVYIYLRNPSLTFIAIRNQDGGQVEIEKYLVTLTLK